LESSERVRETLTINDLTPAEATAKVRSESYLCKQDNKALCRIMDIKQDKALAI